MNARSDKLPKSYTEQLTEFDNRLRKQVDDESTLQELTASIKRLLLSNVGSESDIRAVLHKRLQDGHIHDDTFRLVLGMLDSIVSEDVPTVPGSLTASIGRKEPFASTTVLPDGGSQDQTVDGQVQLGSVLRDRFQLKERVASGGMGVVYKAIDKRLAEAGGLEPWVAIKVLNPQLASNAHAVRALQQEAAKGRCLSHPNIVRFIDIDRDNNLYFIVMEWLEGRSLASVLNDGKGKSIDYEMSMDIIQQLGQALDYAHKCGVVHADVKPSNIIITPSGSVKLIDFGIARVRQQQSEGDPNFDPGLLGSLTPVYSSMQVLTGETPVPADDVFSLGCLMYRLVAGYRVFGPRNAAEAAEEGMVPQRPQRLGDTEWRALKKSLAIARVSRFPSANEFLDALSAKPGIRVSPEDTIRTIPELPRETPWGLMVTGVLAIAAALAVTQTDIIDQVQTILQDAAIIESASAPATEIAQRSDEPDPSQQIAVDERKSAIVSDDRAEIVRDDPEEIGTADAESDITHDDVPLIGADPVETVAAVQAVEQDVDSNSVEAYVPIDFSSLPPATAIIPLAHADAELAEVNLTLIEDGRAAIVDLVRESNISLPLDVDFVEVGFSGNRSPLQAGQYMVEGNGVVRFAAGQARARTVISMSSDPLREPDRTVTLLLRNSENVLSELAIINLRLEDDDQRTFEARLPSNTVAFAVSQVSVHESDPAAQVDIIRFNPDATPLSVGYIIRGVTATNGEDFFEPRTKTISFGPGQRSARILIPLVQDNQVEADEAFMLELVVDATQSETDLFRRIAVMIRDDDSAGL